MPKRNDGKPGRDSKDGIDNSGIRDFDKIYSAASLVVDESFDFEIGHLIKSPCRDCVSRENLPNCTDGCVILDQIQAILREGIPSENRINSTDIYNVPDDVLGSI